MAAMLMATPIWVMNHSTGLASTSTMLRKVRWRVNRVRVMEPMSASSASGTTFCLPSIRNTPINAMAIPPLIRTEKVVLECGVGMTNHHMVVSS